ncbi:unnamed protein product [Rotaria sp. Silwood2]|nr:unnamed protein product [Rotaria sp. Silwood2]
MFDNIASLNFIHYDKLLISIEKQQNEQIHLNNQENSIYATTTISLEKEETNFLNSFQYEYYKFETVLTINVHTRDTVDILIRDGISEPLDFSWQCQLRFYWLSKEDNLFLQQCNGKFEYSLKR